MINLSRQPLARLLFVGMLVPAIFVAIDYWLLDRLMRQPSDTAHVILTMAAFVVQVGLLGWLCGRFLDNPWWRWSVYLWGWLLIDLQVLSALTFSAGTSDWTESGRMLSASLLAAQIGLAIIWGVLGTTYWAIRVPLCGVLGILLAVPLLDRYSLTSELLPVGVPALVVLCLALRWRGFCLLLVEPICGEHDAGLTMKPSATAPVLQFGVRHVLIWTTSLAIVLGLLRGMDMLSLNVFQPLLRGPIVTLATAGILVAALFIVALWAALGDGPAWLRWPVFALATTLTGLACMLLDFFDRWGRYIAQLLGSSNIWELIWEEDGWILAWMSLAGGLLCASTLILRVIGYRLVRPANPRPVAGVGGG